MICVVRAHLKFASGGRVFAPEEDRCMLLAQEAIRWALNFFHITE